MRFKLNSPFVAYDVIEEEVVIVNLRQGYYYSIRGSGVDIWTSFVSGLSFEEVVEKVSACYQGTLEEITVSVRELLEAFKKEEFLIPVSADDAGKHSASVQGSHVDNARSSKKSFVPSRIEKFTDMEDILLLDPIHDVDDKGWPNRLDKKE